MSISSRPRAQEQKRPVLVGYVRHAPRGFWVQSEGVAVREMEHRCDGGRGGGRWMGPVLDRRARNRREELLRGCMVVVGLCGGRCKTPKWLSAESGSGMGEDSLQMVVMKASCSIESMTCRVGK